MFQDNLNMSSSNLNIIIKQLWLDNRITTSLQTGDKSCLLSIKAPEYWKCMHLTINTSEHSNNCMRYGVPHFSIPVLLQWLLPFRFSVHLLLSLNITQRLEKVIYLFICKNVIADDPRKTKQKKDQ